MKITRPPAPDLVSDPFLERAQLQRRGPLQLLGAQFQFESNSRQLLDLVDSAYAGLPPQRLSATVPRLRVRLLLTSGERSRKRAEPPRLEMFSGAGFVGGASGSSDFVVVSAQEKTALVTVSAQTLRSSYHVRYEMLEFAVFTLATRVLGLAPLHAACVGAGRAGVLMMGHSGAGKSTVALQCLLEGMDFLSEDSVLVAPGTMLATGVANFLHVRSDSLRWIAKGRQIARILKSPVIQRRSGVKKLEIDLRHPDYRLASSALKIGAVVFLSEQPAGGRPLLTALSRSQMLSRLTAEQPYAASQPEWPAFVRSVSRLQALELRRGLHPSEAVEALRRLLGR